MADAILSKQPTIAAVYKEMPAKCNDALVVLLADLAAFFNIGKQFNEKQILETAELIRKEFYYLKFTDLKFFFTRFKTGYYGQIFDRLDGAVIMINLRAYCEERIREAETMQLQKHEEFKAAEMEQGFHVTTGKDDDGNTVYLSKSGENGYEETVAKDRATRFTFSEAVALKAHLIKNYYQRTPDIVKIKDAKLSDMSLMQFIREKKPHLISAKDKYQEKAEWYSKRKKEILSDESLSPLQQTNAIRALTGLEPLSTEEFIQREKEKITPPKK